MASGHEVGAGLRDLIGVGLIDALWSRNLAARLKKLLDTPDA
jgi:hypothetical protein